MSKHKKLRGSPDHIDMKGRTGELFIRHVKSLDRIERLKFLVKFAHCHTRARRMRNELRRYVESD